MSICPYCNIKSNNIIFHINNVCLIKPHYNFINFGDFNCEHENLIVIHESKFKKGEKYRVILTIKCEKCNLFINFDTYESIWLPDINTILKEYKHLL